jgi:hypothetical protein
MPFKYNQSVRHKIPKQKIKVTNWAEYNEALRKRGDFTLWISDDALKSWQAEPRKTRGGQAKYSDMAIEICLTLRVIFNLALRQTQGFVRSVMKLLKVNLSVPDYSTLSKRAEHLNIISNRKIPKDPITLIVDSTGLKINGNSEWCEEKYGAKPRKTWHSQANKFALSCKTQITYWG